MLLRLLVVLTLVGPPGPRVCTCAVAKAAPASLPAAPTVKSCRCGHHAAKLHAQPTAQSVDAATHCDHTNPAGHEPNCPAAHPQPAPSAIAVPAAPTDTAADAAMSVSFDTAPAYHPVPAPDLCGSGALRPHVPLFITFHVLRN
jgi:hypothetical protein